MGVLCLKPVVDVNALVDMVEGWIKRDANHERAVIWDFAYAYISSRAGSVYK